MKRAVCILVMVVLGSALAQAQTEKGRWTVGAQVGNLSYSGSGEPFRTRQFSASLSPSAGYFLARNLVIGASVPISYSHQSSSVSGQGQAKGEVFGIGLAPFARYYFGTARLRPFVNASVGFQQFWTSSTGFNSTETNRSSTNFTSYSAGAGAAYFINNTVSLDASLNYTNYFGSASANLNGSLGLNIGFRLFFGK